MAENETDKALKEVREAQNIITETLDQPGLTSTERKILDELSDLLREIDDSLLLNDLMESTAELKEKNKKLTLILGRTDSEIEKLKGVAERVNSVAGAIKSCVVSFETLASSSLI